jgi:hypothetical protein
MKNILILYPDLFNCFSKFERKVKNITGDIEEFNISYLRDSNKLVSEYVNTANNTCLVEQVMQIDNSGLTHAIIFDDGESFNDEIKIIRSLKIPLRIIKVTVTRVINIKKEIEFKGIKSTANYEYIGRGSYWGNPHSMFEEGDDREEVIRKYKYDFDFEKFPHIDKSEVFKLVGKKLGCFCKPATCHGDVLADFLNEYDDGK